MFIILTLVVLGMLVWLIKGNNGDNNKIEWVTYTDPEGVFSFEYPRAFSVSGREGARLATVLVPQEYMPETNFLDAELTIDWTSGATDATCSGTAVSAQFVDKEVYDKAVYKKIFDGDCYILTSTIHTLHGLTDPEDAVHQIEREKVEADFQKIIDSFQYLVDSD